MPIIMERIDYRCEIPSMPFLDTKTGNYHARDLYTGGNLPKFGIWLDKRYCRCGRSLESSAELELGLEDPVLERALDYLCPVCAMEDRINLCSLKGIPRLIVRDSAIECDKCYKYPSFCSSGYCVYLAILSDAPIEVKVGITRVQRVHQRAVEGGYSAMAVLLPKERNFLSLPEAQFIEKNLVKSIRVHWQNRVLIVNEFFRRNIGFVGKDLTKRQTLAALLSPPSQQLRKTIEDIALSVIPEIRRRGGLLKFSIVEQIAHLEIVDIPDVTNGDVDYKELKSIDLSDIVNLKRRQMHGRPIRLIPNPNKIIAVKGPCVLLRGAKKCYSLRLSRFAVQGREVFDYELVKNTGDSEQRYRTLDWFTEKGLKHYEK